MEDFLMNNKERERERIFSSVEPGLLNLVKAAQLLKLSYSHTKRLWSTFKKHGPKGLVSKKRGKKSNRAVPDEIKKRMIRVISENFQGCKPLYVSEVLEQHYGFKYSSEFIRQLMTEHHLWIPKSTKRKVHQRRKRRECEGELVQVDASQHNWFEGRLVRDGVPSKAYLHLFIDDATSTIYGGYFDYEETKEGYFHTAKAYFEQKGLPKTIYNDRRSTFIVNHGKSRKRTQFARAMDDLGVEIIYAYSPEAKGRVERTFGTHQDRLVWEMRRLNITTLEEANKFLPIYFALHNNKFAVKPASTFDAHHPLDHKQPLKYILCKKEKRSLRKNLEVLYNNRVYQMELPKGMAKPTRKTKVDVITTLEGELHFKYRGELLSYKIFEEQPYAGDKLHSEKVDKGEKKLYKPSKYHPWRRKFSSFVRRAASVFMAFLPNFG